MTRILNTINAPESVVKALEKKLEKFKKDQPSLANNPELRFVVAGHNVKGHYTKMSYSISECSPVEVPKEKTSVKEEAPKVSSETAEKSTPAKSTKNTKPKGSTSKKGK